MENEQVNRNGMADIINQKLCGLPARSHLMKQVFFSVAIRDLDFSAALKLYRYILLIAVIFLIFLFTKFVDEN